MGLPILSPIGRLNPVGNQCDQRVHRVANAGTATKTINERFNRPGSSDDAPTTVTVEPPAGTGTSADFTSLAAVAPTALDGGSLCTDLKL